MNYQWYFAKFLIKYQIYLIITVPKKAALLYRPTRANERAHLEISPSAWKFAYNAFTVHRIFSHFSILVYNILLEVWTCLNVCAFSGFSTVKNRQFDKRFKLTVAVQSKGTFGGKASSHSPEQNQRHICKWAWNWCCRLGQISDSPASSSAVLWSRIWQKQKSHSVIC